MHTAGVEFDHSFFVGNAAKSDGVIVRVIFRALHNAEGSVQRVAAVLQENEGVVEVFDAIVGAHDDRTLEGAGRFGGAGHVVFGFVLRVQATG